MPIITRSQSAKATTCPPKTPVKRLQHRAESKKKQNQEEEELPLHVPMVQPSTSSSTTRPKAKTVGSKSKQPKKMVPTKETAVVVDLGEQNDNGEKKDSGVCLSEPEAIKMREKEKKEHIILHEERPSASSAAVNPVAELLNDKVFLKDLAQFTCSIKNDYNLRIRPILKKTEDFKKNLHKKVERAQKNISKSKNMKQALAKTPMAKKVKGMFRQKEKDPRNEAKTPVPKKISQIEVTPSTPPGQTLQLEKVTQVEQSKSPDMFDSNPTTPEPTAVNVNVKEKQINPVLPGSPELFDDQDNDETEEDVAEPEVEKVVNVVKPSVEELSKEASEIEQSKEIISNHEVLKKENQNDAAKLKAMMFDGTYIVNKNQTQCSVVNEPIVIEDSPSPPEFQPRNIMNQTVVINKGQGASSIMNQTVVISKQTEEDEVAKPEVEKVVNVVKPSLEELSKEGSEIEQSKEIISNHEVLKKENQNDAAKLKAMMFDGTYIVNKNQTQCSVVNETIVIEDSPSPPEFQPRNIMNQTVVINKGQGASSIMNQTVVIDKRQETNKPSTGDTIVDIGDSPPAPAHRIMNETVSLPDKNKDQRNHETSTPTSKEPPHKMAKLDLHNMKPPQQQQQQQTEEDRIRRMLEKEEQAALKKEELRQQRVEQIKKKNEQWLKKTKVHMLQKDKESKQVEKEKQPLPSVEKSNKITPMTLVQKFNPFSNPFGASKNNPATATTSTATASSVVIKKPILPNKNDLIKLKIKAPAETSHQQYHHPIKPLAVAVNKQLESFKDREKPFQFPEPNTGDDSFHSAIMETSLNESTLNNYNITVYEEYDDDMTHRKDKQIPGWAKNSGFINRAIVFQLPIFTPPFQKFVFPKGTRDRSCFPKMPMHTRF